MRSLKLICVGVLFSFNLSAEPLDLQGYRLVDLTYAYNTDTVFWPAPPTQFKLEQLYYGDTAAGFFYSANKFCLPEHGGTHLDAPIHFARDRETMDRVGLERLIGPVVVIDISSKAAADRDYRVSAADVLAFEAQHGRIEPGTRVLVRTGWSSRWPDATAYLGHATDAAQLHFPSYGAEAARLLVEVRQVALLGIDTASIDYGPATNFPVHRIAAAANVPGLENVTGLEALPPRGALLVALPMKIEGGSGGPTRVVALVPQGVVRTASGSAELTQLLKNFLDGASRNDVAVHDRFWAEDLVYTRSAGVRMGKAEIMENARSGSTATEAGRTTYAAEDIRIQQYGDTAVVAFQLVGTTGTGEKAEVAHYLNTGTFVKRNGEWRAVAWQATTVPGVIPTATAGSTTDPARAAVDQLVTDYIGLYTGPTLDRWQSLFHPAVVVAFPDEGGTIRTRTLEEFVTRQKNYFATGRRISERLENVRVDMGRRIARVSADFIFVDEGKERPGMLGLHLAEETDGWKIVAVLFAYDAE